MPSIDMTDSWAVLFDLDGTLVETSKLAGLRSARRWTEIYASLARTNVLPGTNEMLAEVTAVAQTGVVTTAPRPYAERLLMHHGLAIPVVVAYHDVQHQKPHPESIQLAARRLEVPTARVIYIGDEVRDVVAATDAGGLAIAFGDVIQGNPAASGAVAFARSWADVTTAIQRIIRG